MKFIMPSVKLIEIIFGLFLLSGFAIPSVLRCFAPVMFVVTGLHVFHNPKPWMTLALFTVPYCILF